MSQAKSRSIVTGAGVRNRRRAMGEAERYLYKSPEEFEAVPAREWLACIRGTMKERDDVIAQQAAEIERLRKQEAEHGDFAFKMGQHHAEIVEAARAWDDVGTRYAIR
jgi:hypothetical protein